MQLLLYADVSPVTGGVTDGEEDGLIFRLSLIESNDDRTQFGPNLEMQFAC